MYQMTDQPLTHLICPLLKDFPVTLLQIFKLESDVSNYCIVVYVGICSTESSCRIFVWRGRTLSEVILMSRKRDKKNHMTLATVHCVNVSYMELMKQICTSISVTVLKITNLFF